MLFLLRNRSCIKRLRKEAHLQEVQEMAPNGTAHCTLHIDGFIMSRESAGNKPQAKEVQSVVVSNGRIHVSKTVHDATDCRETVVLHAILPFKVKHKDSNELVIKYAFYDNGSGGCFATENIRRQLGVDGVRVVLATMHRESQEESTILDKLIVTSLDDENPIE